MKQATLLASLAIASSVFGADKARPVLRPIVSALSVVGGTWTAQGPAPIHNAQGQEGITNKPAVGAVNAVVAHPTSADTVWIGAVNGGVWKTTNATNSNPTWTPQTDTFSSLSIESLTLDPTDGTFNTLVAGTGSSSHFYGWAGPIGGLLRTTNGGTSWTALNPTALAGKGIAGLAARGATIVVGVDTDSFPVCQAGFSPIYRSTNTGSTFSAASGLPSTAIAYDLRSDPTNNAVLYAAIFDCTSFAGGIYKSTNTGSSWTKVSSAAMDTDYWGVNNARIAVGASGQVFFAFFSDVLHIYRSTNGGAAWTALDSESTQAGCLSLAADASNTSIAYFGRCAQTFSPDIGSVEFSGKLYRVDASASPGSQLTPLTHCTSATAACNFTVSTNNNSAPHADTRDMAIDANGNLLQTDDGGIYRRTSPSGTGDWFSVNGSLAVAEMHDVAYDGISNMIFGGDQDTGSPKQTSIGGTTWTAMEGTSGDGGDVAVDDTTSITQSTRYASSQGLLSLVRHKVNNLGVTTSYVYPERMLLSGATFGGQFVVPLELNRVDARRALYGGGNDLYETLDRGDTITGLGLNQAIVAAVYGGTASSVDNIDLIWAVANPSGAPKVYVRTSGGGAPSQTSSTPGSAELRDITVDSADWHKAFVINAAGQVYSTSNTGSSWTNITGNLGSGTTDLRAITFVPPSKIVVGGLYGVFIADTSSPTAWSQLGSGLPNALVWDLDYDTLDDVLIASTLGRSTWKLSPVLVSGSLPSLSINDAPAVTEGNSGSTNATFTVTLSASSAYTVGVQYATANGTATMQNPTFTNASGIDAASNFGTSPYPSSITVSGVSDPIKKVTVSLNGFSADPSNGADVLLVGPGGQKVMLMSDAGSQYFYGYEFTFDDSAASQLPQSAPISGGTFRPTDYETGDSMPSPAPSGPYGTSLSAFNGTSANGTWNLYLVNDTGAANYIVIDSWSLTFIAGDYAPVSGQLVFPPGTTTRTISVPVYGDTSAEATEQFTVVLSSPSNATTADDTGVGTITNDEANAPTSVVAAATTTTSVHVTWTASAGASTYRVYRSSNGSTYTALTPTTASVAFDDTTASANTAYLYKVRAIAATGTESPDSNVDLATTVIFTDPTLTSNVTKAKAVHSTELLTAVNAVRTLAGLSSIAFTSPTPAVDVLIKGAHVNDLRTGLAAARSTLGLSALSFTDSTIVTLTTPVKLLHITELRTGVQ